MEVIKIMLCIIAVLLLVLVSVIIAGGIIALLLEIKDMLE
jgi:hypothetical protein